LTEFGAAVMNLQADTRGSKITESDEKELIEKFSTCCRIQKCHPHCASRAKRAFGFLADGQSA